MDARQAETRLREMLVQAGVDPDRPDPLATWRVFGKFAAEEIDGIEPDDDGFLLWWGIYGDTQLFQLGFLRQFSFYAAGVEYDHMEQLRCTFHFAETPELQALGKGDDWWFRSEPRRTLSDWIAEMEAQPAFNVLNAGAEPIATFIKQGVV